MSSGTVGHDSDVLRYSWPRLRRPRVQCSGFHTDALVCEKGRSTNLVFNCSTEQFVYDDDADWRVEMAM